MATQATQTPQATQSNRERLGERLKAKYPDRDYADDEALYGQVNDELDDYDGQIETYKSREKELTDMFNRDPRSAKFITDMARGEDPWLSLIRRVGIDGVTELLEDPAKQEAFAEENKKHIEDLAREKELEEEYNANLKESLALLERIQQERGLSDEEIDAAYDLIGKIAHEVLMGTFTEETVDMALKALNHDQAVEEAGAQGEVRGRNARIEEKLRRPSQGDGTVQLAQGSTGAQGGQRRRPSIFEEAALAQ